MKMPGPYVPLDVNYARDRAIAAAGEEAELLYVRALAYCKGTYSEGFVPDYELDEIAKRLKRVQRRVDALVREELWSTTDGGWIIRNWSRWNESSEEVTAKREREAERQRRKRARDKEEGHADVTPDVQRDNAVTPLVVTPPKERQGKAEAEQGTEIAPASPTRPTDEIWDALLSACNIDPANIPSSARGAYNAATKQLRDIGADPAEIRRRAAIYRGQWRDVSLTPTALARRWAECDRPASTGPAPSRTALILNAAQRRAEAAEAQQHQQRRALP